MRRWTCIYMCEWSAIIDWVQLKLAARLDSSPNISTASRLLRIRRTRTWSSLLGKEFRVSRGKRVPLASSLVAFLSSLLCSMLFSSNAIFDLLCLLRFADRILIRFGLSALDGAQTTRLPTQPNLTLGCSLSIAPSTISPRDLCLLNDRFSSDRFCSRSLSRFDCLPSSSLQYFSSSRERCVFFRRCCASLYWQCALVNFNHRLNWLAVCSMLVSSVPYLLIVATCVKVRRAEELGRKAQRPVELRTQRRFDTLHFSFRRAQSASERSKGARQRRKRVRKPNLIPGVRSAFKFTQTRQVDNLLWSIILCSILDALSRSSPLPLLPLSPRRRSRTADVREVRVCAYFHWAPFCVLW